MDRFFNERLIVGFYANIKALLMFSTGLYFIEKILFFFQLIAGYFCFNFSFKFFSKFRVVH